MILAALVLAGAQAAQAPREFIEKVYESYGQAGFNPLAEPGLYFTPELSAAMERDSSGGEVGYLDGDPLCDCQDYDRLSAKVVTILQPSPRAATAQVHVDLGKGQVRDLQLRLIRTPLGWRISDVLDAGHHSLLHQLEEANSGRCISGVRVGRDQEHVEKAGRKGTGARRAKRSPALFQRAQQ